ncbi:hypothetical protein SEUBUCD646_0E00860 [Saccharomyces eubayanus]|uniref:CAP-Gly domain-containing protein n=1 Tax=Saccharomyces eubayanus TaxID=1080349 RepID=A0ABN8VTS2_SACEU|nr:hypothetical protein SEUBUCD650_0E00900 [Saccharomyces eubayanus]CAI1975985.1 hypothetical protein SEUBUCD646_0E00860 [Saccharomyces eubayanus]
MLKQMAETQMSYEVGDRLKIGGYCCTVKFIGAIKSWPSVKAYGVEWDDPNRGRNSGTVDGIHYFDVNYPNSGSFLKESKIKTLGVRRINFFEALLEKYGSSSSDIRSLSIGSKKIESLGFEKLDAKNKNLKKLRKITLRDSDIATLFQNQNELDIIVRECTSVNDLDLSLNLFTNVGSLCKFLEPLKSLRTLDISQNKLLSGWGDLGRYDLSHITKLRLSSCDLSWEQIGKLLKNFNVLKMLDLSCNKLTYVGIQNLMTVVTPALEELNITGNNLESFPEHLAHMALKDLNISNNNISKALPIVVQSIETLDLSENHFKVRSRIDDLNIAFPSLKNIRLNGNDLKSDESSADIEDQATFYEVLARFDHVMVLNGSICDRKTRREAEMYFISKVLNSELDYDISLPRWKRLIESYGIGTKTLSLNKIKERRKSLVLKIKVTSVEGSDSDLELSILPSFTVRYVKSIICRKLKLDILRVNLTHENCKGMLNEITHNFCPVSDFSVVEGDIIHVHVASKCQESKKH